MSITRPPLTTREQIAQCNRVVASRLHMPVALYKLTKALVQLGAIGLGFFAIQQGAAPLAALGLTTLIVGGLEGVEYWSFLEALGANGNEE